jgi:DNA-directed RNA polymerase sigma subunit (sigma70/sigma32)
VLPLARDLRVKLGRAPTAEELAEAAGVSVEAVRTALFFGRVMGRG